MGHDRAVRAETHLIRAEAQARSGQVGRDRIAQLRQHGGREFG